MLKLFISIGFVMSKLRAAVQSWTQLRIFSRSNICFTTFNECSYNRDLTNNHGWCVEDAMLPLRVIKFMGKMVRIGSTCGFIPYSWNKTGNKMGFHTSRKYLIKFLTQFAFIILYEIFLVTRCIQFTAFPPDESSASAIPVIKKIRLIYLTGWFLSLNVNQVVILKNFGMHRALFQNFMDVMAEYHQTHGRVQIRGDGRTVIRVISIGCFGITFACFTNALAAITNPTEPRLLTSVFPNPKTLPIGVKLVFALFHLYFNCYHYYLVAFNYSTILIYVSGILKLIPRMNYNGNKGWPMDPRLSAQELQKYYKILSVLQNHFNSMFGLWTLVFEMVAIFVTVINIFQAAVYEYPRALVLAFVLCVAVLYIYETLGHVHEVSDRMLATWITVRYPRWFPKALRAAPPLHVKIGSFFFADRTLVLTILLIICNSATNLILTFRYD